MKKIPPKHDLTDCVEIHTVGPDGSRRVYKRCGFLPDLFASEDGDFVSLKSEEPRVVNNHPYIQYRANSLSARALMADAWSPGWDRKIDGKPVHLAAIGDRLDLSIGNLRVASSRGRPAGMSTIKHKAELYQVWKQVKSVSLVAQDYDCTILDVMHAIQFFEPEALSDPDLVDVVEKAHGL